MDCLSIGRWGARGWQRRRRDCGVALMAAILGATLAPAAAGAATYSVWSCRGPAGEPLATSAWTQATLDAGSADVAFADTCAGGGSLRVSLAPGRSFGGGVAGAWRFAAPAGTRIAGYELWRSLAVADPSWHHFYDYRAGVVESVAGVTVGEFGCSTEAGACRSSGDAKNPLATANHVVAHTVPLDAVALQVTCEWGFCEGPSGVPARADLYRSRVLIDDPAPPADVRLSGAPTVAAPLSGVSALVVGATDRGAGIASISLSIDGGPSETAASSGCVEPYTVAPPCPAQVERAFTVDATRLADGAHSAAGSVVDAAGNATAFGPVRFTVAHTAPSLSADVPVVGGATAANGTPAVQVPVVKLARAALRHAAGAAAVLHGTLQTAAGGLIAGARLAVTSTDLGTAGAAPRALAPVVTDATGAFAVTLKRDGAQRVTVSFSPRAGAEATATATATVLARLALAVHSSRGRLVKGRLVTLSGRLRGAGPSARGALIQIESIVNGTWTPVGAVRARAGGAYHWRYRFVHLAEDTVFSFRAVVEATPGWPWSRALSPRLQVRVDVP
jgi:hypothetical protein